MESSCFSVFNEHVICNFTVPSLNYSFIKLIVDIPLKCYSKVSIWV